MTITISSKALVVKHAKSQGNTANYIRVSSLTHFPVNDCAADPEELAIINRCRLLLIEAGADITLGEEDLIGEMLDVGTPVFLVSL